MEIKKYEEHTGSYDIELVNNDEMFRFTRLKFFDNCKGWHLYKYRKSNEYLILASPLTNEILYYSPEYYRRLGISRYGKVYTDTITTRGEAQQKFYNVKYSYGFNASKYFERVRRVHYSNDGMMFTGDLEKSNNAILAYFKYNREYGSVLDEIIPVNIVNEEGKELIKGLKDRLK